MFCHHPSLSRHITSKDWQEVTTHCYINLFHTLCSKSRDPGWWTGYGWLTCWLWMTSVTTELPNAPKLHLKRKSQKMASLHGFNGWKRVTRSNYLTKIVTFLVNKILKIFRTTWEQSLGFILRSPDTLMKFAPCRKARVRAKRHCTTTWNEVPQSHGGICFHMVTTFLRWMLSTKHFENKIEIYRKTMFQTDHPDLKKQNISLYHIQ